jgi:hypothetical protein
LEWAWHLALTAYHNYAAWKNGGDDAIETIWQVTDTQCCGNLPPDEFNDSATLFVPKGEFESDAVAICREPLETRPLSLKNSDNKICAAVVNRSIADVVKQGTHKTQNGFVPGRQLIQNPVDLDAAGRLFSMIADDENKRKTTPSLEPPASFRSHLH